jgi:predicted TIM-barrel fold metal-dependent hydrolase
VRDLPAEEFLNLMDAAKVDRAILVQAFGAYKYDNSYVADAAARYPDRFVAVCIVDAVAPTLRAHLALLSFLTTTFVFGAAATSLIQPHHA